MCTSTPKRIKTNEFDTCEKKSEIIYRNAVGVAERAKQKKNSVSA